MMGQHTCGDVSNPTPSTFQTSKYWKLLSKRDEQTELKYSEMRGVINNFKCILGSINHSNVLEFCNEVINKSISVILNYESFLILNYSFDSQHYGRILINYDYYKLRKFSFEKLKDLYYSRALAFIVEKRSLIDMLHQHHMAHN